MPTKCRLYQTNRKIEINFCFFYFFVLFTFCLFSLFLASAISVLQKAFCCLCNLLFSLVFFFLGGFTLGSLIYLFTYKFFALPASRKFTVCLVSCIRSSQFKFYSLTHTHKHTYACRSVCMFLRCLQLF